MRPYWLGRTANPSYDDWSLCFVMALPASTFYVAQAFTPGGEGAFSILHPQEPLQGRPVGCRP